MSRVDARTIGRARPAGTGGVAAATGPPGGVAVVLGVGGVVLAAAVAVASGASPTGIGLSDVAWLVASATIVAIAAPGAGPTARAWMVLVAAVALVLTADAASLASAGVLLGAVLLARAQPAAWTLVVAVSLVAVTSVEEAARTPGLPGVLAVALGVPLVVSAVRRLDAADRVRLRRWSRWVAWPLVGTIGVAGLLGAVGVAELRRGVAAAGDASTRLGEGDRDGALEAFTDAEDAFDTAAATFDGPWTVPARLVPLLGDHLDAARATARGGRDVTRQAVGLVAVADLERLRSAGGVVDLPRLRALSAELDSTSAVLGTTEEALAAARSPWLLPPIGSSIDGLAGQVGSARQRVELASEVSAVAPAMLGADGPRRYLVLVTSPAEARELGGFVASIAEVEAVDGDLVLVRSERSSALNDEGRPRQLDPAAYPERFTRYQPQRWWQDVSGMVDFPLVARAAAELWEQQHGRAVDGVVALDPRALAALLELTGPITVDGLDAPLDASMADAYLLREQYLEFPERADRPERADVLARAADATFRRLTGGPVPAPVRLAAVLGPPAEEGRLLLWSRHGADQALAERLGVDGAFPEPAGGDLLSVVHANANPSKVDVFLHRRVRYDVQVDPSDGSLRGALEVVLRNDAPAGGLPDYVIGSARHDRPPGTNHLLLSVHSPHEVVGATVDGAAVTLERTEEHGVLRWSTFVDVPPGGEVVVALELVGRVEPGAYRLALAGQPLVHDDDVTVDVALADGWDLLAVDGATRTGPSSAAAHVVGPADRTIVVGATPAR